MEYVTAVCPSCKETVIVPKGAAKAFCHCCGAPIPMQGSADGSSAPARPAAPANAGTPGCIVEVGVLRGYHGVETDVTIPRSVRAIAAGAFRGLPITSVTIPDSVSRIGDGAFAGCVDLVNVSLPRSIVSMGAATFEGCSKLASIELPVGLRSVPDSCFKNCASLSSVSIPSSVTRIGDGAFQACGFTSLSIPGSVQNIGEYAFADCRRLQDVSVESIGVVEPNAFVGCGPEVTAQLGEDAIRTYEMQECGVSLPLRDILARESRFGQMRVRGDLRGRVRLTDEEMHRSVIIPGKKGVAVWVPSYVQQACERLGFEVPEVFDLDLQLWNTKMPQDPTPEDVENYFTAAQRRALVEDLKQVWLEERRCPHCGGTYLALRGKCPDCGIAKQ